MTTVQDIIDADGLFTEAIENLREALVLCKPAGASWSVAMEDATADGVVGAQKSVWQSLRELLARFFNFILGRSKQTDQAAVEAARKAKENEVKFEQWFSQVEPEAQAPTQASEAGAQTYDIESIKAHVQSKREDIIQASLASINTRFKTAAAMRKYIGKETYQVSDLAGIQARLQQLTTTVNSLLQLSGEFKTALAAGPAGKDQLDQVSAKINPENLPIRKIEDGGVALVGNPKGVVGATKTASSVVSDVTKKNMDASRAIGDLKQVFESATSKAEAENNTEYAQALRNAATGPVAKLGMATSMVSAQCARLSTELGNMFLAVMHAPASADVQAITKKISEELAGKAGTAQLVTGRAYIEVQAIMREAY